MLTKDEALERVWRYFSQHGISEKRQPCSVRLITRQVLNQAPHIKLLAKKKPDAYKLIQDTFRDHWAVLFETGAGSPAYHVVEVDAETGEVRMLDVL